MTKLLIAVGAVSALTASLASQAPVLAASNADCVKRWAQVYEEKDGNKSISLQKAQAAWAGKAAAIKAADTNKDNRLSDDEFMAACTNGDLDAGGDKKMEKKGDRKQ